MASFQVVIGSIRTCILFYNISAQQCSYFLLYFVEQSLLGLLFRSCLLVVQEQLSEFEHRAASAQLSLWIVLVDISELVQWYFSYFFQFIAYSLSWFYSAYFCSLSQLLIACFLDFCAYSCSFLSLFEFLVAYYSSVINLVKFCGKCLLISTCHKLIWPV